MTTNAATDYIPGKRTLQHPQKEMSLIVRPAMRWKEIRVLAGLGLETSLMLQVLEQQPWNAFIFLTGVPLSPGLLQMKGQIAGRCVARRKKAFTKVSCHLLPHSFSFYRPTGERKTGSRSGINLGSLGCCLMTMTLTGCLFPSQSCLLLGHPVNLRS